MIFDSDIQITKDVKFRDLPPHDAWKCGRRVWNTILCHVCGDGWPIAVECMPDDSIDSRVAHLYLKGELVHELRIYK